MKEISVFQYQMTNVYQLLYSRNSTERVKLNLSFVIFKCISRHFRGIKIKIFQGACPHAYTFAFSPPPPPPPPSQKLAARALTKDENVNTIWMSSTNTLPKMIEDLKLRNDVFKNRNVFGISQFSIPTSLFINKIQQMFTVQIKWSLGNIRGE